MRTAITPGCSALLLACFCTAAVAGEEGAAVVKADNAFAFDLYGRLKAREGNLFFSPYSIATALQMTLAGAAGETAAEMEKVLRLDLGPERTAAGAGALGRDLNNRKIEARYRGDEEGGKKPFELAVANSLWGQKGFPFEAAFTDLTARAYAAGLGRLDFAADPEGARKAINDWVLKNTAERIKDLLQEGDVNAGTLLVLANALYFKSGWDKAFEKSETCPGRFALRGGGTAQVPFMRQESEFKVRVVKDVVAVELPYKREHLSMIALMPPSADGWEAFEDSLDLQRVSGWLKAMDHRLVELSMPVFRMECRFDVTDHLAALGMPLAFSAKADFSGLSREQKLFIGKVIHQAFVAVDEEGTEAAAATAVIMDKGGDGPSGRVTVRLDRPFFFLIRDNVTGVILFLGRVENPGA